MKKSTKKLARHLTALFAALAVGLGTLPAAAFAADAPEPIPEQPAIVGVESAQEEGQSDAVGTDTVGTGETGTDAVGTGETGTDETETGETGTDETETGETGTDETGTDETGTDETETGGTGTDETGTDETTPSEDAVLPTEPATQPEQPEETPAAGEAPDAEEIPAEVEAFLNAVAKIPADITPDNAEEAAELIYGEVSEAYEALLGTEYEGRADVQEAAALYAAAIEAVDAALELNSVTFDKIPVGVGTTDPNVLESAFLTFEMWEADHTIPAVTVSGNYADADYVGEVLVNPDGKTATIDSGNLVFYTNYGIAVTTNWTENGGLPWIMQKPNWLDISLRADGGVLYVTFTAKPGAQVGQTGTVKLNYGASWAVVTNNAFFGEKNGKAIGDIYYKVTVGDGTVTVPEKPEKPTDKDIQDFYSNNIAVIVRCVDNAKHNGTLSRLAKGSYTVGEVEAYDGSNKELSTDEWSWMCKVHVDQDYYLKLWHKNFETTRGTHYLNDADKDVYAPFYYFKGGYCSYADVNLEEGWYCLTEDAPVYVDITHKKPAPVVTYTVVYTDGAVGEIVFADQVYEGKKAGDNTPSFEKADFGTITLDDGTVQPSRDGYTFQGWSPAVNPVVSADDANRDGEIIYTATWQKNTSTDDLTITKTADKNKAEIGEEIKYTIKVENNSGTSATVKVVDKLPEKVDFVKVSDSDGGVYDKTTHTVTWENVTVPAHGSKQLLVWVKANTSGTIENKATVTLDGQDKESDPAIVEVPKPDPGEAEYAVKWIDAANNTVLKSENRTGTVGTTVTVNENDKAYPGYTYVGDEDARNVLSATLEESGTVLKLYFTKDTENPGPGPGPDEPGKDQYNVTYKWTGLPENHNETLPEGGKYEEGAEVTVDTNYYANKEVVIGEKTYVFSGWSTSDADIENGKFTMPNKDVTLIGTWTEKAENPGPGPDEPGKDQYNVTYKWTGLPENHNETLPEGGKYEKGETVTVDTSFVKGQEVIVGGKTYVFSGWDQTGSFAMPAEDVTINGSWSEKPVTPTPGPDPVDPTPGEPDDPTPPSGGYVPRPRPVTPPVVDVPEIDVPLVETPVVEFVEPEVPLTEAPELPEAEVPEEDVPLADIPKTGDSGLSLWAMLAAFSLAGILALGRKLRTK